MSKFKRFLQKHPFLCALSAVYRHRKEKEYLKLFSDMQRVARIGTNPGNLGKAPVCLFDVKDQIGLFAYLRRASEFLYYCDRMGFTPLLKWSNSDYVDSSITDTDNAFEYFYRQPGGISEVPDCAAVVNYAPGNLTMARSFIRSSFLSETGVDFLRATGSVAAKYLVLKDSVAKAVGDFLSEMEIGDDTLGVHIRGTDIRKVYKNHPVFIEPRDYYPMIDEAIAKHGFQKIFLATDDVEILSEFLEHYKTLDIRYSQTVVRGSGVLGIHKEAAFNDAISPYREGVNALCDAYALAACGGIISGLSHLPMFSRMLRYGENREFSFDQTINKGFHKKGIDATNEKFAEDPKSKENDSAKA